MNTQKENYIEIFNSIDFSSIKDHPNILIAARFWDNERYCAAKICYKFMRALDDLIDNHKAVNRLITPAERKNFMADVDAWMKMIIKSDDCNPDSEELARTIERFSIPLWPLEAFARSMVYDINNDGFPTLDSFIDYSQGASVAPASIFVHLGGLIKKNGTYEVPQFNVKEAATQCAIFSYLVHIIRDFQKDQLNNLNYFADDLVKKHRLSRKALNEIANGEPVTENFRKLIGEYHALADRYRIKTREVIRQISPFMEPGYQLSLEIIFDLYLMVFEKIDPERGNFTTEELNPTTEETKKRVFEIIMNFNPV